VNSSSGVVMAQNPNTGSDRIPGSWTRRCPMSRSPTSTPIRRILDAVAAKIPHPDGGSLRTSHGVIRYSPLTTSRCRSFTPRGGTRPSVVAVLEAIARRTWQCGRRRSCTLCVRRDMVLGCQVRAGDSCSVRERCRNSARSAIDCITESISR